MSIVKRIAAIALCLSIAAAGFPAQASAACPMGNAAQGQHASAAAPKAEMPCHKSSDKKPSKSCCCQEMACGGGGLSMDMPDHDGMTHVQDRGSRLAFLSDAPPIVNPTSTQERPPRSPALG